MDYVVHTPPQIFYHFSLISNVFINIHEYAICKVVVDSNLQVRVVF